MLPDFFPCSFHRCCYCCCRYCVVLISHVSKILTCERQRHENALRGLFVSFCEYCSAVLTLGNSFFWHSNIRTQRKRVFDIFHWLLLFVSPLFRFSYLFFSQWLWLCASTTTVVLVFSVWFFSLVGSLFVWMAVSMLSFHVLLQIKYYISHWLITCHCDAGGSLQFTINHKIEQHKIKVKTIKSPTLPSSDPSSFHHQQHKHTLSFSLSECRR